MPVGAAGRSGLGRVPHGGDTRYGVGDMACGPAQIGQGAERCLEGVMAALRLTERLMSDLQGVLIGKLNQGKNRDRFGFHSEMVGRKTPKIRK